MNESEANRARLFARYAHCEALVRAADRDSYLAGLFAPAEARRHLYALHAFAGEIARVRDAARGPLPGEIRLQWWRDVLSGEARGDVAGNPVAAALADTVAVCGLPKQPLLALIDAHAFDLYDDAMPTLADLDAYAVRTAGTLFGLGAHILAGRDDARSADRIATAAQAAGVAIQTVRCLHSFPRDAARRPFLVPLDLLTQHGVTSPEIAAHQNSAGLRAALTALRQHAQAAFDRFRSAALALPENSAPAFLVAALVPLLLMRLDAAASNPFAPIEVPQWRRQWALWRAARRWPMFDPIHIPRGRRRKTATPHPG